MTLIFFNVISLPLLLETVNGLNKTVEQFRQRLAPWGKLKPPGGARKDVLRYLTVNCRHLPPMKTQLMPSSCGAVAWEG